MMFVTETTFSPVTIINFQAFSKIIQGALDWYDPADQVNENCQQSVLSMKFKIRDLATSKTFIQKAVDLVLFQWLSKLLEKLLILTSL